MELPSMEDVLDALYINKECCRTYIITYRTIDEIIGKMLMHNSYIWMQYTLLFFWFLIINVLSCYNKSLTTIIVLYKFTRITFIMIDMITMNFMDAIIYYLK